MAVETNFDSAKPESYYEELYRDKLYTALQYSGLVSSTDSFSDICNTLKETYPDANL